MGARILFRDSQGRDGEISLDPGTPVYVGRSLECGVRTDDAMVSRKHSLIRLEDGKFCVEDLGSSNGTHVNDKRVTRQALHHNDVVRCGSLWLRYVEDGPIAVPKTPPVPHVAPGAAAPQTNGVNAASNEYGNAIGRGPPAMPSGAGTQAAEAKTPSPAASSEIPAAKHDAVVTELEKLQDAFDREVADGKRLRAEATTLRERIEELRRNLSDKDDQIAAQDERGRDLRDEIKQVQSELDAVNRELQTSKENLGARNRQLERAQKDAEKYKADFESARIEMSDVSKMKDEGWKKLNDQLGEIEKFREVINEQERMLEERRVALISNEELLKELRADKEASLQEVAKIKAERDLLIEDDTRLNARLQETEEENKRLTQLVAQGGGGGSDAEQSLKLSADLKEARVELKRVDAERERYKDSSARAIAERDGLEKRIAELEVELREAQDRVSLAESAQKSAQEAKAKAELDRQKAEEEALGAAQARDVAISGDDEHKREIDRLRSRVETLQSAAQNVGSDDALGDKLRAAETRIDELEDELQRLRQDVADAGAGATDGVGQQAAEQQVIIDKANEVYEEVNDALSSLRGHAMTANDEFAQFRGDNSSDSAVVIAQALEELVDSIEEAKGSIRALRELVEFGT